MPLVPFLIVFFLVFFFAVFVIYYIIKNGNSDTAFGGKSPSDKEKKKRRLQFFTQKMLFDYDLPKYDLAARSVVALFAWMIRRDGVINDMELRTARLYFQNHKRFNIIMSYNRFDVDVDPICGQRHQTRHYCNELLDFYNKCPQLLTCNNCCYNIINMGVFYEARLELFTTLYQVAFSSDGVIANEKTLLDKIAYYLQISQEDKMALDYKFGMGTPKDEMEPGYSRNTNQSKYSQYSFNHERNESTNETYSFNPDDWTREERSSEQSNEQARNGSSQRSDTYGYKLVQAYNALNLLSTSSVSEVKSAYRALVKKYHPDLLPADATDLDRKISMEKFRQISDSYELICLERGIK